MRFWAKNTKPGAAKPEAEKPLEVVEGVRLSDITAVEHEPPTREGRHSLMIRGVRVGTYYRWPQDWVPSFAVVGDDERMTRVIEAWLPQYEAERDRREAIERDERRAATGRAQRGAAGAMWRKLAKAKAVDGSFAVKMEGGE